MLGVVVGSWGYVWLYLGEEEFEIFYGFGFVKVRLFCGIVEVVFFEGLGDVWDEVGVDWLGDFVFFVVWVVVFFYDGFYFVEGFWWFVDYGFVVDYCYGFSCEGYCVVVFFVLYSVNGYWGEVF